jgi:hypothetical protein
MSADLSLLFVIALRVAGLIWVADRLFFKAKRSAQTVGQSVVEPKLVELARSFFPVIDSAVVSFVCL